MCVLHMHILAEGRNINIDGNGDADRNWNADGFDVSKEGFTNSIYCTVNTGPKYMQKRLQHMQ